MPFFYALLLGLAVSLDAFAAGAAYGIKNISLPLRSLTVVGAVTAVGVAGAMLAAHILGRLLDLRLAAVAGSILMITLGLFNLFQEYLAETIAADKPGGELSPRQITLPVGRLVITIMAKPETADLDSSHSISLFEAIFLGLALGLDNMVATFAASLMGMLPLYTPLLMAAIQMTLIAGGTWVASRLPCGLKQRFPFVPGAILIFLGVLRLH